MSERSAAKPSPYRVAVPLDSPPGGKLLPGGQPTNRDEDYPGVRDSLESGRGDRTSTAARRTRNRATRLHPAGLLGSGRESGRGRILGAYLDITLPELGPLPGDHRLNEVGYIAAFHSGEATCPDEVIGAGQYADGDAFYGGCIDSFGAGRETIDPFA